MPPSRSIPVIDTPEHQIGAMALVLLTRTPDEDTLKAAVRLADHAAVAVWALRPDHLGTLAVEQYRQLLDYGAAPQVLDLALYLGGDPQQIRTLMDHITRSVEDICAHYPDPASSD
ncbi:hypothetical protein [Streptomyces sp. NPDC053367]|uniref:hypothetical protein n=1 Tax=Streptomyces sp. NPDC053367 TaxID=3365700 RepID=UPI0037CE08AE